MGEAFVFGAIASSALVLGALAGVWVRFPKRVLAAMLSFAAGALITALTFEMFEDSYEQGGIWRAALGLAVGATLFTVISQRLDRLAEGHRKDDQGSEKLDTDAAAVDAPASPASVTGAAGLALLAAATLDGIPENLVLGVSLGEATGSLALLVAIFVANFPEALVGSASMRAQGRSTTSSWAPGPSAPFCSYSPWLSAPARCPARPPRRFRCPWPSPQVPSSPHWRTRSCPRPTSRVAPPSH